MPNRGFGRLLATKTCPCSGPMLFVILWRFPKMGVPKSVFFSKNHTVIHDLDDLGVALFSEAPETRWRVLFIVYFCHWDDMLKIGLSENMAPQDQMIHHISIISPLWSPFKKTSDFIKIIMIVQLYPSYIRPKIILFLWVDLLVALKVSHPRDSRAFGRNLAGVGCLV